MNVEFNTLPATRAIVITCRGHISAKQVRDMRARTVELQQETGFQNYLVDLSDLESIARGDELEAFELGIEFRESRFSSHTRTAVIPPNNPEARKQAEFLHVVEINRGRGELRYVSDLEDARAWFDS